MKKILLSVILTIFIYFPSQAGGQENLSIIRRAYNKHGILCKYKNQKTILFIEGSPEQMGQAHGQLLKSDIKSMEKTLLGAATVYMASKGDSFFTRINEVMRRTKPFSPKRFLIECDAMSKAAGITAQAGRHINYFPEMFHCSGVAVRGSATTKGQVIHARVLDYMKEINLHKYAVVMVFMPVKFNSWVSVSYAGFVGTVTAMNEKGLAMGEMGGKGQGKWDGLPMSFMMRRVMEECATVEEAVALMKKTPLTCDYYYILSDKNKSMRGVIAISGSPLEVLKPGEQNQKTPPVPPNTVYLSKGKRARLLGKRLHENFGKIDVKKMIEIIKHPVAMKSNLHNAVFLPESLIFYFADADDKTLACFRPYYKLNLKELIKFYKANKNQ
jgi:isopenicillin-N N-acyltransferase like protein